MLFDVKMEKFFRMLLVFYSFDFSFVSQNYYNFEKKKLKIGHVTKLDF